jgi:hypothetical protein
MLYTRSSFMRWLQQVCDCQLQPINNTIRIKHGPATAYMYMTGRDVIDYEEIYILYGKLYLPQLPGDSDLERVE